MRKWPSECELPSLRQRVRNLVSSTRVNLRRWWHGEQVLEGRASAALKRRRALCRACPRARAERWCCECGCHLGAKTLLTAERCPIGRWEAERVKQED